MINPQLFIPAILLFSGYIHAQSGPVSAGNNATGAGGSVSYSIGQIDYLAPSGSGGNINEGLQQPYEIFSFGIEDNDQIEMSLSIYPNPTTTSVFLKIEKDDLSNLFYQLYDVHGQPLSNYTIVDKTTQIAMEQYSSGTYVLKVFNGNTTLKSFKIIKK